MPGTYSTEGTMRKPRPYYIEINGTRHNADRLAAWMGVAAYNPSGLKRGALQVAAAAERAWPHAKVRVHRVYTDGTSKVL